MQRLGWAWALAFLSLACSSSERSFAEGSDGGTGGSASSTGGPGSGASTTSSTGTAGVGGGGAGGGAEDAGPPEGGVADCTGQRAGTNCSPAGSTGSICLADECVVSRCGDGYVDGTIGEDCETGEGCTACKFACKMASDCSDGNTCNGAETCDTGTHSCAAGTAAADGTNCMLSNMAPGKCATGTCVPTQCGNGMIDMGEDCDPGVGAIEGCTKECKWACKADADCDDGDACSGVEKCDLMHHSCVAGTKPSCDDMKVCTVDSCDPATGCVNAQVDKDKDGFTVCDGDCDDADPNVNPGHAECADSKDNNCNKMIDEGVSPLQCYPDGDKDGYAASGATAMAVNACSCPTGYTTKPPTTADCADHVAAAFPGQTAFFPTSYCKSACSLRTCLCLVQNTSYDYDCNGTATQHYTALAKACALTKLGLFQFCSGSGWTGGAVPACGVTVEYQDCKAITDKLGATACIGSKVMRTQECH